jgi:hypothetical protein
LVSPPRAPFVVVVCLLLPSNVATVGGNFCMPLDAISLQDARELLIMPCTRRGDFPCPRSRTSYLCRVHFLWTDRSSDGRTSRAIHISPTAPTPSQRTYNTGLYGGGELLPVPYVSANPRSVLPVCAKRRLTTTMPGDGHGGMARPVWRSSTELCSDAHTR